MTPVLLALGSNLGDRAANLRAAVALLGEAGISVRSCSSIWETEPVPPDQPPYLNAAIAAETGLGPEQLLVVVKGIERALGRRPGRRWGPRPVDIDILFYGEVRIDLPGLQVPHPRVAERGFVLAPLAEIHGGPLPVLGERAAELLARAGAHGLRRTSLALA